ncbi:MAG: hypothetical protein ACF8TS_10955 [Maioricimonas sp. JB049]
MSSSTPSQAARCPSRLSRCVGLISGLILAVVLLQRPLDSVDLWWDLARGREVLAGTFFPSRELLTLETLADADWLGGTPFFFAWSIGGIPALGLVPLAAGIAVWVSGRLPAGTCDKRFFLIALAPLILYVIRDDLQPVPQLLDIFGLILTSRLIVSSQAPSRRRVAATLLLFAAWSNLAAGPLWGLLLLMLHCGTGAASGTMLLAAVGGGMLNPRGPLAWHDSFVLLAAGNDTLARPEAFTGTTAVFLLLWICWVGWRLARHRRRLRPLLVTVTTCLVPIAAGLLHAKNIPIGGAWILVHLSLLAPSRTRQQSSAPPPADDHRHSADERQALLRRTSWGIAAGLTAVLLMLDYSVLPIPGGKRPGWGIASSLDYRLVDPVWRIRPDAPLRTWTPDAACAGMIAWIGENLQLVDHPERARLGGRWQTHAGVVADIAGDHRAQYRRADGSWGGWRAQLSDWDVALITIPAASPLHQVLSTTPWKSLDLDAPCLPYVSTNDLRFASLIVDVLRQQGFVEAGPWQPTAEIYDGHGWRVDLLQGLGLGHDPTPAIAQSQHFRALGLPMAAARALRPAGPGRIQIPARREWIAVQQALTRHEEVTAGQPSLFRQRVLASIQGAAPGPKERLPAATTIPETTWEAAIRQYLQGRLRDVVQTLPESDSEGAYAAALVLLEAGETAAARARLAAVASTDDNQVLRILAEAWLREVEPFVEPPQGQGAP